MRLLLFFAFAGALSHKICRMKRKSAKFLHVLGHIVPFLCVAVLIFGAFPPRKSASAKREQTVVRIWNIDTFEGGKGSRTAFLRSVARSFGEREGVYFLVTSYTSEGADEAFLHGEKPDLISFGIGLSCFLDAALPLPYVFPAAEAEGKTRAVPWCCGGYVLFSLEDDFQSAGKTAISVGGANLGCVAARYAEIEGEELPSEAAYTGFLAGKYRYLLGTQRDACRFAARGVSVFERPLPAYNDLFQCISLLNPEKEELGLKFIAELLSPAVRSRLWEIGMTPFSGTGKTFAPSLFCDETARNTIAEHARGRDDRKIIDNFLKTV